MNNLDLPLDPLETGGSMAHYKYYFALHRKFGIVCGQVKDIIDREAYAPDIGL